MTPPNRLPSRAERALWHAAMRETRPFDGRTPIPPPVPSPAITAKSAPSLPPARHVSVSATTPSLDRSTADKLRRGQLPIEGRLDLHGMTRAEAQRALAAFVTGMAAGNRRTLLVITGKGNSGVGVLRREVPLWLKEPSLRPLILAVTEATLRHGGAGALYVLLRRQRAIRPKTLLN